MMADDNQNRTEQNEKNGDYTQLPNYFISRQVLQTEEANKISGYEREIPSYMKSLKHSVLTINFLALLNNFVPATSWLPSYPVKKNLLGDITSGITVAVMHIPQGMAYALLTSVSPKVGLYMAFFPTLAYFLFGTSRHISMGTFAVISLMVAKTVQTHATFPAEKLANATEIPIAIESDAVFYTPLEVVTAVSMMVGFYQLLMCVLRLGVLSSLLSEPLVNGFTTAAAFHVLISQVKDLLGITIPKHKGVFKVIFSIVDIFKGIHATNMTALLVSAVIIVFMVFCNELLKPWMAKKCRFPIPSELMAVVGGTLMSYLMNLGPLHNVTLVGEIPTGLPIPQMPPVSLFRLVAIDSIAVAIVSYSVAMSMALIFAKKHSYEVRANQELLAMGVSNIVGSFFSCIPISCSLSRSLIQEQTGGKTQVASVVSAGLILVVLLWIGPFFETLPRCVLAGIIVVALKGMFMQVKELKKFYQEDKLEALTWFCTFFSVVLIDIDIGLICGIVMSIITLYLKGWQCYSSLLGVIPDTGIYVDLETHKSAEEIAKTKIFHYAGSINFASRASFKRKLYETIGVNHRTLRRASMQMSGLTETENLHSVITLILDLSCIAHIDYAACKTFSEISREMQLLGCSFLLACPSDRVYDVIMHADALGDGPYNVFPTIHDAVLYSQGKLLDIV